MTRSTEQQLADAIMRAETAEALLEAANDTIERLNVELSVANGGAVQSVQDLQNEMQAQDRFRRARQVETPSDEIMRQWIIQAQSGDWSAEDIKKIMEIYPSIIPEEYRGRREPPPPRNTDWSVDFDQRIDNGDVIMRVKRLGEGPAYNVVIDPDRFFEEGQSYMGDRVKIAAQGFRDLGSPMSSQDANTVMREAMYKMARIAGRPSGHAPTGRYSASNEGMITRMRDEFLKDFGAPKFPPSPKAKHDPTPKSPKGKRK